MLCILLFAGVLFILWQLKKDFKNQEGNLLNQKSELNLLRDEVLLNRDESQRAHQEFHFYNLTQVVYKQLERFEKSLEQFEYDNMKGYDAFKYLFVKIELRETEVFNKNKHESVKIFNAVRSFELKELIALETMSHFAYEGVKNTKALQKALQKSKCTQEQANELKDLFVNNLNARYFVFIAKYLDVVKKKISGIPEEYALSLFQKETFLKDHEVAKNLKEILDFKKKKIVKPL